MDLCSSFQSVLAVSGGGGGVVSLVGFVVFVEEEEYQIKSIPTFTQTGSSLGFGLNIHANTN